MDNPRLPSDSPWAPLQRYRRIGWVLWFGYIPAVFLIGRPLAKLVGTEIVYLGVALCLMGVGMLIQYRAGQFRCPRCGQRFYRVWTYQRSYANNCAHCGLPKWADPRS